MHIKDKIIAKKAEWMQRHHEQHLDRLRKISYKKLQQRRRGWPNDKSPV
jgi:hypothetical protein